MRTDDGPQLWPDEDQMHDQAIDRGDGSVTAQDGSPEMDEPLRRRAYLLVPGLLAAVLARNLVIEGFDVPYWGVVAPLLIVLLVAVFVGVWRRRLSLWAFEVCLLVMVAAALLGFLLTWSLAPVYMVAETMNVFLVMLWSGLVFPLAFLVLGTRRGLQASVAFYAAFVVLAVPPIAADLPAGRQLDPEATYLSLAIFFAVMIALLWVLASRLEALAAARAEARLFASQAATDVLTGLPNRRQLDDQLDREIARTQRHREPLSILLLDIDHFKAINDRYGHQTGDHALHELASRLSRTVRGGDLAGRWGGEEFLVIAPNTGHVAALELAERCRAVIAGTPFVDVGTVTASFGVATITEHEDARSLVHRVDTALYRAKDSGRDAVAGTLDPVT